MSKKMQKKAAAGMKVSQLLVNINASDSENPQANSFGSCNVIPDPAVPSDYTELGWVINGSVCVVSSYELNRMTRLLLTRAASIVVLRLCAPHSRKDQ